MKGSLRPFLLCTEYPLYRRFLPSNARLARDSDPFRFAPPPRESEGAAQFPPPEIAGGGRHRRPFPDHQMTGSRLPRKPGGKADGPGIRRESPAPHSMEIFAGLVRAYVSF